MRPVRPRARKGYDPCRCPHYGPGKLSFRADGSECCRRSLPVRHNASLRDGGRLNRGHCVTNRLLSYVPWLVTPRLVSLRRWRFRRRRRRPRSEEHTSELQSLMRISYAVFCLKKKKHEYKLLYQRNTCSKVQPTKATYQIRQKCQPATYLKEILYQL